MLSGLQLSIHAQKELQEFTAKEADDQIEHLKLKHNEQVVTLEDALEEKNLEKVRESIKNVLTMMQ